MALVAYSDDSELDSEVENVEENEKTIRNCVKPEIISQKKDPTGFKTSFLTSNQKQTFPFITDIVDVDDESYSYKSSVKRKSSLLASIPAALPVNYAENGEADVGEDAEDELTDVPTVDTWKVTTEIKQSRSDVGQPSASQTEKSFKTKEKKKVKIFIPALSEFEDDDEEEDKEPEPERKKLKPSAQGTGLFSVLPEPKHLSVKETKRSLIPYVLTKAPPAKKPIKHKPVVPAKSSIDDDNDSDDDKETGSIDFFSLSESPTILGGMTTIPIPQPNVYAPIANVYSERHAHDDGSSPKASSADMHKEQVPIENTSYSQQEAPSNSFQGNEEVMTKNPYNMDQEAMIRLMGKRRGKTEEVNFINIHADDALLTRDEWMTKTLSEEKPSHSYSSKREGLPSQKQKQKHQITYLAHQAKERELELKNNWAQNRMTKMKTQAKYGF